MLTSARYLIVLIALAPLLGCQTNIAGVYIEGYEQAYYKRVAYEEGLAIDNGDRRQIFLKFRDLGSDYPTGDSQTFLLFISMPVRPGKVLDVKKSEVFFVWSSISLSVAGFMNVESLDTVRTPRGTTLLSGDFISSQLYTQESEPRKIEISVSKIPLEEADSMEEADRRGYTEAILESLRIFDIPTEDRDHWLPQAPQTGPTEDQPEGSKQ